MQFWDMKTLAQLQRKSLVYAGRALNTTMDYSFYDVSSLSQRERAGLSARTNPEGSILIVHPRGNSHKVDNLTPMEFISRQRQGEADTVAAAVDAGVGSYALVTAALARNVAD